MKPLEIIPAKCMASFEADSFKATLTCMAYEVDTARFWHLQVWDGWRLKRSEFTRDINQADVLFAVAKQEVANLVAMKAMNLEG